MTQRAIGGVLDVLFLNSCKEKQNFGVVPSLFGNRYGVSPFEAPTPEEVFAKILSMKTIEFPEQPQISDDAKDLICGLISPAEKRLGANGGLIEVQKHAWFRGIVWGELQYSEPPFLPELENQLDIGYFPSASKANLDQLRHFFFFFFSSFNYFHKKKGINQTVQAPAVSARVLTRKFLVVVIMW